MPHEVPARVSGGQWGVLALIVTLGAVLRVGYLVHALGSPGYVWEDPDGYSQKALQLIGPDGWRWTFDAVTHTINGQRHALPPLYSVFLSLFALFPGYPVTAQVGQLVLGVLSIVLLFGLGRRIHSTAAGLVASAACALWVPGIFGVWSTSQETLYLPLILLGFLLLLRAIDRHGGPWTFLLPGAVFGAAALTRSMPLFFAVPAAILHVALAAERRRASVQAAAFLVGFALLPAPYSAALSRHFGQLTVVDTHGSIHFQANTGGRAPGMLETAGALARQFAAAPAAYLDSCLTRARSLMHVNGGRQLQIYVVTDHRWQAVAWKAFVHLGNDFLLVAGSALAAIGLVLCRRPRLALFFVAWALLNIGVASVGGFGGARLRVPFEPLLFVLAAVVVTGRWRRPHLAALAPAVLATLVAVLTTAPQVPVTLAAWPDYGVRWPSIFNRRTGQLVAGAAGVNVPAPAGIAAFTATAGGTAPVTLHVNAGGVNVRTVHLTAGEAVPVRALWPDRGLAFVELVTNGPAGGGPAIRLDIEGR